MKYHHLAFRTYPSFSFGKSFENESIVVQLDKSNGSTWNNFGFSPYKWMHTDISLIYSTSALTFKIKASEIPKLKTSFIAYTRCPYFNVYHLIFNVFIRMLNSRMDAAFDSFG
jgi:hypothetical protein